MIAIAMIFFAAYIFAALYPPDYIPGYTMLFAAGVLTGAQILSAWFSNIQLSCHLIAAIIIWIAFKAKNAKARQMELQYMSDNG